MSYSQSSPEKKLQSILKNISVGGNLTTGDISQILNLFVIVHQPNTFIPKSTPYNIPSSNTIKFVGRADSLEQLHQALQQNSQVAITAIEGMGGVGKTELATQYCLLHLLLNTYPGGICWLRARDEDIGIQILRFAEAKLDIKPPKNWELNDKIDFCWSRWQEKKEGNVLIVLDDVNNYPKIQPYIPPQLSQFKVLITTRLQLDLPQSFSLDILSESASLELLRQWIGEEKVNQELTEGEELCLRLGYLPLALNLVGRYIKKRKISLSEMLRRLEEKGLQHQALNVDKKDRTQTLNIQRGVAAAFELSWEELSEDAKKLGCLLSLFTLAPIPWDFVTSVNIDLDYEALEDARIEIENLHLIQYRQNHIITYQLHQLIREFFKDKLDLLYKELKNIFCQAISNLEQEIPDPYLFTHKLLLDTELIQPHISEAALLLQNNFELKDAYKPFLALGKFYNFQGQYKNGEFWLAEGIKHFSKYKLPNFGKAKLIHKLGFNYYRQEKYLKSIKNYKYAYKIFEEIDDLKNISIVLADISKSYIKTKKFGFAEEALEEARKIKTASVNFSASDKALIYHNFGHLFAEKNEYAKAECYLKQSIKISITNKIWTILPTSLSVLAKVYIETNKLAEAEKALIEAKQIIESFELFNYPFHSRSLENLVELYYKQGKKGKALNLHKHITKLYISKLGKYHPVTINYENRFNEIRIILHES